MWKNNFLHHFMLFLIWNAIYWSDKSTLDMFLVYSKMIWGFGSLFQWESFLVVSSSCASCIVDIRVTGFLLLLVFCPFHFKHNNGPLRRYANSKGFTLILFISQAFLSYLYGQYHRYMFQGSIVLQSILNYYSSCPCTHNVPC